MSRTRLIIILTAIAALSSMALASSAFASYRVVRNSGWVQFRASGTADSDCWIQNELLEDSSTGNVFGGGRSYCYDSHTSIQVREQLTRTNADSTHSVWYTPLTPLYSQSYQWVSTSAHYSGCTYWQSLVQVYITDGSRTQYGYKTSSTPVKFTDHCPF